MPTKHPRLQVTVDPELGAALDRVGGGRQGSRARLLRDLALRGAEAELADEARREEGRQFLLDVADGKIDFDFDALREIIAQRK